jgi:hypothetical protein
MTTAAATTATVIQKDWWDEGLAACRSVFVAYAPTTPCRRRNTAPDSVPRAPRSHNGQPAATRLRRRSVHRVTDDAEAAELEPSEELVAARALETGLVEQDETYIYTPDELQEADVVADYVWLQKGTGRKVYLVRKEQGRAS